MELGSWSLISAPSLFALIPLILFIVLCFRGKNNVSALILGISVGVVLLGLDFKMLANAFQQALGSTTSLIGLIIMIGAGLGILMSEAHVTHTLVYWIVQCIGVNTRTKAKLCLVVCSILVCGLLGTMAGGNVIIAPIMLPIMAALGITPTVVAVLFKVSGEIGLILGPLTGVTLITLKVTGLTYGQFFLQAGLPYALIWIIGTWIGCNRAQRLTEGKEFFEFGDDVKDTASITITPQQRRTTIAFLISFVALIAYGVISKQGTAYSLLVMIILAAVITIFSRTKIDHAVSSIVKGASTQVNMFFTIICCEIIINQVTVGGGFQALSNVLGGFAQTGGPAAVMLTAAFVGGFGIEAIAVAEIQIIASMFGGFATSVGLPMGCFAISILAATRLTGSLYPGGNFMGQLGISQCTNVKGALQALWIGLAFVLTFIVIYAFVGPMVLS